VRLLKTATPRMLAALGAALVVGCARKGESPPGGASPGGKAIVLSGDWNTPGGMTEGPGGDILVSMPNLCDPSKGAGIVRISPSGGVSKWFGLPPHPETGSACPLGLARGPDGNVYWIDNQELGAEVAGLMDSIPDRPGVAGRNVSRLCRIVVEGGRPVRSEVLVEGFFRPSGVTARGDAIYVSDASLGLASPVAGKHPSGVYVFYQRELDPGRPITLKAGGDDEHLIYTLSTLNGDSRVGASGIAFGADGTMYVCNFGDAKVMAVRLDEFGNIETARVLAKGQGMKSCRGLRFDKESGLLYCADMLGNAVHEIDPETGRVRTVRADPEPNDGSGNRLDRPIDCLRRGDRLYVSNSDLPIAGNEFDPPHTISVIDLE